MEMAAPAADRQWHPKVSPIAIRFTYHWIKHYDFLPIYYVFILLQLHTRDHCIIPFLFFFFQVNSYLWMDFLMLSHPTHDHTSIPSMLILMIFEHVLLLRNNPSVNSFYIYRSTTSDSLTLNILCL